jgi:hypothetical protein
LSYRPAGSVAVFALDAQASSDLASFGGARRYSSVVTGDEDSTPWVDEESPEQERLGWMFIGMVWPRVDELDRLISGPYMTVELGSSLALDRTFMGPWRGGGLEVGALNAALDALKTVRLLLDRDERVVPMTGLYPVLRAAVENASLAVYLLTPEHRDDRLRRVFREAAGEVKLQQMFALEIGATDTGAKRKRWDQKLAAMTAARPSLGLIPEKLSAAQTSAIVRAADAAVRSDPASKSWEHTMPLLAIWQLLSGLSHGKYRAMMTALARSDAIVSPDDDIAHVRMTTRSGMLAMTLLRAVGTLETATRVYGVRARRWSRRAEDAEEDLARGSGAETNDKDDTHVAT